MGLVFEPQQQRILGISQDRQAVFGDTGLVARAFPAPDLAVPGKLAGRGVPPASIGCRTGSGNKNKRQRDAPIQPPGTLKKPQQGEQQTAKPHAEQERAQKTRTPQRINNRRGVVGGQGVCERAKNQARLKTSVPLVPPKPKLFLTATSIFASRAVLAQ